MSSDDVTVTDRDRAKSYEIVETRHYSPPSDKDIGIEREVQGRFSEQIALSLAQARSEGVADGYEALKIMTLVAAEYQCEKNQAEEALRVAREHIVNLTGELRSVRQEFNTFRSEQTFIKEFQPPDFSTPTTASTKTDADECKEDLVEFLKAAWDTETGFTNGNSFYRLLPELYGKYCITETPANED